MSSRSSSMSDLSCPQWRNSQSLHGLLTISFLQLCGHQGLDTIHIITLSGISFSCTDLCAFCFPPTSLYHVFVCDCVHLSKHLCLRDELCDLLAGVERCHLHVSHTPVGPARGVQDLVMFLQDLTEPSEVQVLLMATRKQLSHIYSRQTDWNISFFQANCCW